MRAAEPASFAIAARPAPKNYRWDAGRRFRSSVSAQFGAFTFDLEESGVDWLEHSEAHGITRAGWRTTGAQLWPARTGDEADGRKTASWRPWRNRDYVAPEEAAAAEALQERTA